MKKLTALLLALVMVLAMNAIAFADNPALAAGGASGDTTPPYGDATIGGTSFTVTLSAQSGVSVPGTKFTYEIANGTPRNTNISASNPEVKAGEGKVTFGTGTNVTPGDPAITADVAFPSGTASVTVPLVFADHSAAGIYRYTVTQKELDPAQTGAGFKTSEGNGNAITYYLDVYVNKNGKVYGTALSTTDGTNDASQLVNEKKVAGYENVYSHDNDTTGGGPDGNPDSYDVTLEKTLGNGGLEETTKAFPFKVNVTVPYHADYAQTNGLTFTIEETVDTGFASSFTIPDNNDGAPVEINGTLKGGEKIKIKGLPAGTVVEVQENAVAADNYNIAAKVEKMDSPAAVESDKFASPADSTTHTESTYTTKGTVKGNTTDDGAITYLNYRAAISPTGVVLRIAPYAIMLGAGVVLFIILKSRKNKAVEEA